MQAAIFKDEPSWAKKISMQSEDSVVSCISYLPALGHSRRVETMIVCVYLQLSLRVLTKASEKLSVWKLISE